MFLRHIWFTTIAYASELAKTKKSNRCLKLDHSTTSLGQQGRNVIEFIETMLRNFRMGLAPPKLSLITLKHPAFEEENEWRLISEATDKTRYRPSPAGLIPYIDLSLDINPMPIKEIIVGPSPHQERNLEKLKKFIANCLGTDIVITSSSAPYRNW